jgi:beta-lactam-binding protein with PASTA domain
VPDVRRLEPIEAARRLVAAGLNPGRVFEITVDPNWKLGLVVQQAPPPGKRVAWGAEVALAVSAGQAGPTSGRAPPLGWPRVTGPPPEPAPEPPPETPRPPPTVVPSPQPETPRPETPRPETPPPAPSPAEPVVPPQEAVGSPDAPTPTPEVSPDAVPALLGLSIVDAEHLAASAKMQLHPERVAGHPVGTVLTQTPAPGAPRPPGGVIKVTVAAGGDHLAELAPPPMVEVLEIGVPDLLDRTEPQARRILTDMGLVPVVQEAPRGPAGRVADQQPAAGTVVRKGSQVIVRVAPSAPARPTSPPSAPAPPSEQAPTPATGDTPAPLSPAAGTLMGPDRHMSVGFTWRPLRGADAYVAEVEELGPDGWMPIARGVTRTNVGVLEIERLSPTPGVLRWRVRGVTKGRQGKPCAWVVLR